METEGKLAQLIEQKRAFLRQATKDYSAGGNDMLDDIDVLLSEAKKRNHTQFRARKLRQGR